MAIRSIAGRLAAVASVIAFSGVCHGASLLTNGSFETTTQASGTWNVYPSIDGWTTTSGPGIEIRNDVSGTAQDGVNFVELDSHPNPGNSWMSQTFSSPGSVLDISYWYAARPGTDASTNGIEIWLNGTDIGNLFAPGNSGNGTNNTAWTLYSAIVTGIAGSNTLEFRAVGNSDTYGGSLDNVSVNAVPLPGTLGLLGLGLAGMGVIRRRKAS